MKELGETGLRLHAELREAIEANRSIRCLRPVPLMKNLVDLAEGQDRSPCGNLRQAWSMPFATVRPGDAITVKGSLSMKMALINKALKERYGASPAAHALKG